MKIPDFPLPSQPRTEIHFRMPTVDDAMLYSDSLPDQEEATTTKYLNAMQAGEVNDSALWTAQDRRTALWWIYINSRTDTVTTYPYSCQHCGETHFYDFDLRELSENAELLTEVPERRVTVPVQGVPTEWTLKPLDGRGICMLEKLRFMLPEETDPEYKNAERRMRLAEIALNTALDDDPDDYEAAANRRYDLIATMATDTEFVPLVAKIHLMQRELRHGLDVSIERGVVSLVLPPHSCEAEGKEGKATRLLVPFRNSSFIPNFKSEWLVNRY
ncbi:hypothetical protein AAHD26_003418 [Citrobacter freundii]|uniref:hypothetical protein n=1 Tax=Citrobacter freundii TaxID=546 RepID=UPI00313368C0